MLFVDLWQSPIMGFTHYETCLTYKTNETKEVILSIGDIIKINNKQLVIVDTDKQIGEDGLRGDSYYRTYFKTITLDNFSAGKENPKETEWTITNLSCMNGPNPIKTDDISIVGHTNIKKNMVTTYMPSRRKMK